MNKNNNTFLGIYAVILCVIMVMGVMMSRNTQQAPSRRIEYPQLLEYLSEDEVQAVALQDQTLWGLKRDTSIPSSGFPQGGYDFETTVGEDFLLTARQMVAAEKGVDVDTVSVQDLAFTVQYVAKNQKAWYMDYLPLVLEIILVAGIWIYFMYSSRKGPNMRGGRREAFGRTNARVNLPKKTTVNFQSVAGAEEEKAELQEMVDFLRNPKNYRDVGARMPKGVLLVGPPGTGKTLLAKAVAGEAEVPFFSISGSDFVEMYVGVGASRVRDLFDQAKKMAPSIVFIDEIDAVGRKRGAGLGGGHDEREQTLNQLLVEMDGFAPNEGVIVMAATNRRDILDPALMRPGRFDRQVTVNFPDHSGRVEILKVHARGKPLDSDVDLENIAKRMPYASGADLENVMNEAAILAARARAKKISHQMLVDAIARVQMGPEKRSHKVNEEDRRLVAVHESGHAIVGHFTAGCDEVHLVTIVPRGQSAGHTLSLPDEEHDNLSRTRMLAMVVMALGGHAAEEVILGEMYTGSSSDLKHANNLCRQMVTRYGMSDRLGTLYTASDEEVFAGMEFGQTREYSEETAQVIDAEVKQLLDACYARARQLIEEQRETLLRLVDVLLREETVGRQEFVAIMEGREASQEMDLDRPRPAPQIPEETPEEKRAREKKKRQMADRPQLPEGFVPGDSFK